MTQAIVIDAYGGPEVLQLKTVDPGPCGARQIRIRQTAIGVNFHDVYVRTGFYRTLTLPGTPGIEAAGVVEEAGAEVTQLRPGDRVAYSTGRYGVYASDRVIDANQVVKLPDGLSERTAASGLLRGLTAEMLLNRVHRVKAGDTILVQAAAGGMGQLLCQWGSRIGAQVIGTASDDAAVQLAKSSGAHHVIRYRTENVVERVMEITSGRGVDVAYDAIGEQTFRGSLDSLALCGHLVNYGQSSGPVTSFKVSDLAARSTTLTRPIVFHYLVDDGQRAAMYRNVTDALADGWLKVNAPREFALADAAESHRVLEKEGARAPLLLIP